MTAGLQCYVMALQAEGVNGTLERQAVCTIPQYWSPHSSAMLTSLSPLSHLLCLRLPVGASCRHLARHQFTWKTPRNEAYKAQCFQLLQACYSTLAEHVDSYFLGRCLSFMGVGTACPTVVSDIDYP